MSNHSHHRESSVWDDVLPFLRRSSSLLSQISLLTLGIHFLPCSRKPSTPCCWLSSIHCRPTEPKRKEAHGDRLSFHPYAFYLFVKVLSLYNASWKNASLTSTSEDVCHLVTSSSPQWSRFARSMTLKCCGFYTGLSQRKFNGMRGVQSHVFFRTTLLWRLCRT